MKFVYKLENTDLIDKLLGEIILTPNTSGSASSDIIDLLVPNEELTKLIVEFPSLYLASNQACINKYICHEVLLSLMSTTAHETNIVNYFLSALEAHCMKHIKNNKYDLLGTEEPLMFKSRILMIDNPNTPFKNKNTNQSESESATTTTTTTSATVTTSSANNTTVTTDNHFESDTAYFEYSDSKQVIHDYSKRDPYKNGCIKIKLLNSKNFSTRVYDTNNHLIPLESYTELFNETKFVKMQVSICLWRHKGVVQLYLRPYKIHCVTEE
jgi:hypothetical protein